MGLFLSISGYNRMVPLLTIGGRIAKGFDFLGYSFEPKGLSLAPKTLANFLERMTQLYEPNEYYFVKQGLLVAYRRYLLISRPLLIS